MCAPVRDRADAIAAPAMGETLAARIRGRKKTGMGSKGGIVGSDDRSILDRADA